MRPAKLAVLSLVGLLGIIAPAASASDGDVLKQFGMLGRQAVDCAAPASGSNPHLIFSVSPQGKVTRTLKMDPELDGTFPIRNLRMVGPDTLQFDETARRSEYTIAVVKIGGKFRSWRSVRADGTILIADGKFPKTGAPTLAFTKCRN